jgi:hypothetical protein
MFNKSAWKRFNDQSGMVMIMALILMVAAMLIVMPGLWATDSLIKVNQALENDATAYYAAKAGIEDVMWQYKNGSAPAWTGSPASYTPYKLSMNPVNGMEVRVTRLSAVASGPFSETQTIKSEAIDSYGTVRRVIFIEVVVNSGSSPFDYGIVALDGGISFSNSAKVTSIPAGQGNIFANGPIVFNSPQNSIDGTATSNSTISGGCPAAGCYPNQPSKEFILVDNTSYMAGASYYGVPNPNIVPAGGTYSTPGSLGSRTIKGNLSLGNNQTLTLTGMLWVTGNISFNNSTLVGTGNPANNYLMADGNITFNGGSMTITNQPTIISWKNNITFTQQTTGTLGTLYAPNGAINMSNSGTINGSIVARSVTMQQSSWVIYPVNNPNPVSGMSGGSSVILTKYIGQ